MSATGTRSWLRKYCELAATAASGQWHALLAEHGVDRGGCVELPEHVERGELGVCYLNAGALGGRHGLTYVQGVATTAGLGAMPIEHAWLETADGEVVDPTWEDGTSYLGIGLSEQLLAGVRLRTETWGAIDAEFVREVRAALDPAN